ncbi:hypothetical protein T492DRAFT_856197 [Pavlovales sp. CCMP2436]|nr:hypothetical protein T492DRAFT_856197 [Pavlovales sp. CCMP2436]
MDEPQEQQLLSARADSSLGAPCVGAACCAAGTSVFAFGGLQYDELYARSEVTAHLSIWTATGGWRLEQLPDGPAPRARSGHTCCAREDGDGVLVFGGIDAASAKLGDLWELCTVGSRTHYELTLNVEAVLTAEEVDADLAARQKGAAKPKGTPADELAPLPLFDVRVLRTALEAALELPAEAVTLSEPASSGGCVSLKLTIEPLLAIGWRAYGVDGEELPRAVLCRMRDRLLAAGVPEVGAEAADAKAGDPKAKGAAKEKTRKGSVEELEPSAEEERPPPPEMGFAIRGWALAETQESIPGVLSWRQWPASGGKPPAPRFSHSSCVLAASDGAPTLLVICGGIDGSKRLSDCVVLDVAKRTCGVGAKQEVRAFGGIRCS